MTTESKKTKFHTVYKMADGTRVPSVTTIIGILNKPALLDWAWRLGLEGQDYKAVRDNAADIGTLAHYLVMCHLTGEKPDTGEYGPEDLDKAENALLKFWEWEKAHHIDPILVESPLVSEQYKFGGTIDLYCQMDGIPTLVDFKTGKGIYGEFFYQLAAYKSLLEETGHHVDSVRILRIGRDENEGFEERTMVDLSKHWALFKHCQAIYELQKELRKNN